MGVVEDKLLGKELLHDHSAQFNSQYVSKSGDEMSGTLNIGGISSSNLLFSSDLCTGGTVLDQYSTGGGEGADKAFDNNFATSKYLTGNATTWIYYRFGGGTQKIVQKYTLTSGNDAPERDPVNWQFQGSNNGSSWTTLDTRTGEDFATRLLTKSYIFSNSTAYEYYRLNVTQIDSGSTFQIEEIEMMELLDFPDNSLLVEGSLEVDGPTYLDGETNIGGDLFVGNTLRVLYDEGKVGFGVLNPSYALHSATDIAAGGDIFLLASGSALKALDAVDGLYLIAEAHGGTAELRIVGNTNAWADSEDTAYFQAKFKTANNLVFMAGTSGADAQFERLLLSAKLAQVSDIFFSSVPAPTAIFEVISGTSGKVALKVKAASSQSVNIAEIQDGSSNKLVVVNSTGSVGIGEDTPDYKLDVNGSLGFTPGTSVTPADNGDVVIEATNNTTLTFKLKGSDGVVRAGTVTLA